MGAFGADVVFEDFGPVDAFEVLGADGAVGALGLLDALGADPTDVTCCNDCERASRVREWNWRRRLYTRMDVVLVGMFRNNSHERCASCVATATYSGH